MSVPPSKKTDEAIIIVLFRPIFSAKGKANKAPKKHPACLSLAQIRPYITGTVLLTWNVETMLPCIVSRLVLAMLFIPKSRMKELSAIVPPMTAVS